MAARVGLATVSYGIGVQNRYSAFLDDEDGFAAPVVAAAAIVGSKQSNVGKQKGLSGGKANSGSLSSKSNGRSVATSSATNKGQDQQQRAEHQKQQQQRADGKRQRQVGGSHQQGANLSVQASKQVTNNNHHHNHNKPSNINQDNTANNNKFVRAYTNNSNYHHQTNASHHQQHNSQQQTNNENNDINNQSHGRYGKGMNQRGPRRQYYNDDEKKVVQHAEDNASNNVGVQSSEEEKRRRQQKRALDLKHKDPEKRDARRQQGEQSNVANSGGAEQSQVESNLNFRNQRNRRQVGDRVQDEGKGVGGLRGRGRREPGPSEANGERREGQPVGGNLRGERPQRNRNGFGTGSRGSRGSRGDDQQVKLARDSDRQKPIPNFSDKLDFPSLAS